MSEIKARDDDTNIEYGICTIDMEGNIHQSIIDTTTEFCKRHRNSDCLLIMVDLNKVLRESVSGQTWIIADTKGYKQLYDQRPHTLSPRTERLQMKVYIPKNNVELE